MCPVTADTKEATPLQFSLDQFVKSLQTIGSNHFAYAAFVGFIGIQVVEFKAGNRFQIHLLLADGAAGNH